MVVVNNRELTAKQAAIILGRSIDAIKSLRKKLNREKRGMVVWKKERY